MSEPARKSLDWEAVHARLREASRSGERTPAECEEILARRARALAGRRSAGARPRETGDRALLVSLGGERFALPLDRIAEVAPLHRLTPVPQAPAGLLGVFNLRGEVRSVLDLRPVLDLEPEDGAPAAGYALVLRGDESLGLYVESVERIEEISRSRLSPANDSRFVRGLTPERIQVLDLEAALESLLDREARTGPRGITR